MIYLVDFTLFFLCLSLCIYTHFLLDISQQRSIRASVCECVYSVTLYMYTERKQKPYINYGKKKRLYIYSVCICCFGIAFSFFAAFFFQYYVNGWWFPIEKQEFVLFLEKEKNKSFFFLSWNRINDVLWLMSVLFNYIKIIHKHCIRLLWHI